MICQHGQPWFGCMQDSASSAGKDVQEPCIVSPGCWMKCVRTNSRAPPISLSRKVQLGGSSLLRKGKAGNAMKT